MLFERQTLEFAYFLRSDIVDSRWEVVVFSLIGLGFHASYNY